MKRVRKQKQTSLLMKVLLVALLCLAGVAVAGSSEKK